MLPPPNNVASPQNVATTTQCCKHIILSFQELLGLHSVNSIFCVCQDEVDLEYFAFVTFDLLDNVHFCHVFKADDVVCLDCFSDSFEGSFWVPLLRDTAMICFDIFHLI